MAEEFAPASISALDIGQLAKELQPLNLPGYKGVARRARRRDAEGLLYDVTPYLEVRCDTLTFTQRASVETVVAAHVPPSEPVDPKITYAAAASTDARLDVVARRLGLV